ncbi:MAG: Sulfate/thiosulfate import ATP-binding protein CysA [Thermoanaerobaculia bacterium]|nr:Sulfate/thiosulfate import ATP-binding protein CysA [Thermoanaerobaculia bacterium]
MRIEACGITKSFGSFLALSGISLTVDPGELVALLGPSGSGKTSLLRIIAGLENPDSGHVLFDGEDATRRDVRERQVGFVFQHYALFRRMTVFENVAFGLKVKPRKERLSRDEIRARVKELLRLVQLDWLEDRYPSELSGGQRQRVALARALAVEPRVLLLDEPFGSLDTRVRTELRRWLRRLHDEIELTSVFVTHDQEEALEVADRVVLLNQGRVEQAGAPEDLFERPASAFVMDFLGNVTIFRGRAEDGRAHFGPLAIEYPEHAGRPSVPVAGYVRAHRFDLARGEGQKSGFWAVVKHVSPSGALVRIDLSDGELPSTRVELSRERFEALNPRIGDRLFVMPSEMRVFPGHEDGTLTERPPET